MHRELQGASDRPDKEDDRFIGAGILVPGSREGKTVSAGEPKTMADLLQYISGVG